MQGALQKNGCLKLNNYFIQLSNTKTLLSMRKTYFVIAAATAAILTIVSCTGTEEKTVADTSTKTVDTDSLVKRGNYLVTVGGCDDCHSPKNMGPRGQEIDMENRFSGYPADRPIPKFDSNVVKQGMAIMNGDLTAAAGPWGVSFAANISSDSTGIGSWSEAQFFKALREGKFKGLDQSRPLLPPMPW